MSRNSKGGTKLMLGVWLIVMLFIGFKAFNSSNNHSTSEVVGLDSATLDRIKPVGQVRVEDAVASNTVTEESERTAEEVYIKCQGCHATGIMEAPKFGSLEDWAPRIERGIDEVLKVAIAGKGGMPPRGTCMDCTDNELKSAVQYMMDSAK
ncbi:MAG: c-type cytochrome [Gammaproteobacteria bacterium]|jgi:cytochrome c5|nr:c-type cytochrome [Gammaproteobacteria bacterium]MDP6973992.1 c-type cytochrome [Gammaproteobacteria bacterium]